MTKKVKHPVKHPFETPELSSRQVKRYIQPLVRRFQEELETKLQEARKERKFPFRYDVRNDMLHCFVASSEGTISSPGHKGIYVDFDPAMRRIVGITVLGFQRNLLPQLEGADDVTKAWHKIRWKLRLLAGLESFAGFFGISFEDLKTEQVQDVVGSWIDWYKENPTKLELMPVATT